MSREALLNVSVRRVFLSLSMLLSVSAIGSGSALAGDQAQLLADVLLSDSSSYEGGSLFGPPESRGTWYSFGEIQPVDGNAMIAFSTGDADGSPIPGTDLGVQHGGDDRAGMNLTLRVPAEARSMRISYRFITPAEPAADSAADEARMFLQGESIGLSPWTLSTLTTDAAGLRADDALTGTWFEDDGGVATAWTEVVLPVSPADQLLVSMEVEDDPASDLGDVLLLLDRLSFDQGIPEVGSIRPGRVPLVTSIRPERILPNTPATLLVAGRDLPPSEHLEIELESTSGEVVVLSEDDVISFSAEQLSLNVESLPEGTWGMRVTWSGGVLFWPDLFDVKPQLPRLLSVAPSTGPSIGGGLALIDGIGFEEVTSLRWAGEPIEAYSILSPEQIELVVPPGLPGSVDVSIFAAGGWNEAPECYVYAQEAGADAPESPGTEGTAPGSCNLPGRAPRSVPLLSLLLFGLVAVRRTSPVRSA